MENDNVLNTQNQSFTNYDKRKIFIQENRFQEDQYVNNSSYDPITIKIGTAMGRVGATGVLVPFKSNASDGSENIIGVMGHDVTVDAGDTILATICDGGDVVKDLVIFAKPGDGMETVISNRKVKDLIQATTQIKLVETTNLSGYDNQ